MVMFEELFYAVVEGDYENTPELTQAVLDAGAAPREIVIDTLQPSMEEVGKMYSSGEYFLNNMLMAARAMNYAMKLLEPLLLDSASHTIGKVVLATVKGDIHDVGKNIVGTFLRSVGFDIFDLGTDVNAETLIKAVQDKTPDIVGLSALLTTTMPYIETAIDTLEEAGLRSRVRVIIGGAPITPRFVELMGADAYAKDGGEAVSVCRRLVGA